METNALPMKTLKRRLSCMIGRDFLTIKEERIILYILGWLDSSLKEVILYAVIHQNKFYMEEMLDTKNKKKI